MKRHLEAIVVGKIQTLGFVDADDVIVADHASTNRGVEERARVVNTRLKRTRWQAMIHTGQATNMWKG